MNTEPLEHGFEETVGAPEIAKPLKKKTAL